MGLVSSVFTSAKIQLGSLSKLLIVIILKEYSNNTYKCIGGSVMCRLLYWVLFKLTIDVFLIVTTHLQWKVDAVPVF